MCFNLNDTLTGICLSAQLCVNIHSYIGNHINYTKLYIFHFYKLGKFFFCTTQHILLLISMMMYEYDVVIYMMNIKKLKMNVYKGKKNVTFSTVWTLQYDI